MKRYMPNHMPRCAPHAHTWSCAPSTHPVMCHQRAALVAQCAQYSAHVACQEVQVVAVHVLQKAVGRKCMLPLYSQGRRVWRLISQQPAIAAGAQENQAHITATCHCLQLCSRMMLLSQHRRHAMEHLNKVKNVNFQEHFPPGLR